MTQRLDRIAVVLAAAAALAFLFGILGPGEHPVHSGESPESLNVMTFNIRYDNPADAPNDWPSRRDLVARTILFHDVAIVGIQEALRNQVDDLAGSLPGYAWFGVGRDDGRDGGEFNPVFYRTGDSRLMRQSTFWLSETPEAAGPPGWDAACSRVVTWAEFEEASSGIRFFVFNTHLDHRGETARREGAALLLRRIHEIAGSGPVIVLGDFNAAADSLPYRILIGEAAGAPELQDARRLSRTGPYGGERSFNGFRDDPGSGAVIDHIFVRGIAGVDRHGIIAEKWDGRFASDHYPVLAAVDLK